MWISLIFDGVIALLLGVTIFYCWLVNQRLSALRSSKDELKQVIEDLTVATTKAQMGIEHLKDAGREVVATLEGDVRDGRALADELALMIEAANNLADRLEGGRDRAKLDSVAKAAFPDKAETVDASPLHNLQVRAGVADHNDRSMPGEETADVVERAPQKRAPAVESAVENELLKALRRAR